MKNFDRLILIVPFQYARLRKSGHVLLSALFVRKVFIGDY
jgi:hypothetical protein